MSVTNGGWQRLFIKTGACSGAKTGSAKIHGISPVMYCGIK
jgi:hypothetical protein